jgi:aryl-phospho-beta-D-glucosidase BglC (GH1 family)
MLPGLQDSGYAETNNNHGRHDETMDNTRNASDCFDGDNNDNNNYDEAVDDPTVLARTELAKVAHKYTVIVPSLCFLLT